MEQTLGYSPIGYQNLAVAIVSQAAKDLRMFPKEVELFFTSPGSIFGMCMPHCDGEAILNQIKKNYRDNNSCFAAGCKGDDNG